MKDSAPTATPHLSALARAGTLNLFGLLVSGLMQIVLTVVVARGLKAGGTGAFFEAVALFTILANVGELGADTGLVRMLPRYRALGRGPDLPVVVRTALWPVFLVCVGLGAVAWALAPALASVLASGDHRPVVQSYLRTLAPFIPLAAASTVVLAGTRGMGTMAPFVWIQNVIVPVLRPVLVGCAVVLGLGALAVALGWAVPLGVAIVLGIMALQRLIHTADGSHSGADPATDRRAISVEFWKFSAPRALAASFGITITWLDILLVGGILHSTRQAGVYAAASRLSVVGAYALNAMGMAVAPQISEFVALRRTSDAESVFQVGTLWLMAITWPLYISIAVFAPLLLRGFGAGFVAGQAALTILCAAQLFNLGTGNVTIVLLMAGRSSWNLYNAAASLAVNVGLNLLLIPRIGITGAAIAWAAAIVCNNLAALLEVRYLIGIRPFGRGYSVVAMSATLCFGAVGILIRFALGISGATFALYAVLSTVPYALVLWRSRETLHLGSLRAAIPRRRPAPAGR